MKSTRPSMLILCPLLLLVAACGEGSVVTGDDGGEGTAGGDCRDGADNDDDGLFDCDDDGCGASPDCEGSDENAAPSGAAIAIEPATPGDDDDLVCTIVTEATDPNGDPVSYTFAWARTGADAGVSGATVGAALTTGGDTWTCTVTPNDGALDGAPASASVIIVQGNEAPSAPGVSISPAAPTDDDVLTCVIDTESVDPDGDAVTYAYAWSVDGADAGVSSATVNAALTEAGQTWTCGVTASDGELESGAGTAGVDISVPGCGQNAIRDLAASLGGTGFWSMDESGGLFADGIGEADAALSGTAVRGVAGLVGDGLAAEFPGGGERGDAEADGYAVADVDPSVASGTRTFVVWARPSRIPSIGGAAPLSIRTAAPSIFSGFTFYAMDTGAWEAWWTADGAHTIASGGSAVVGATAFLASTYSGGTARLYVDGAEVDSASGTYNSPEFASLVIGAGRNPPTQMYGFSGTIDAVATFPTALTSAQVLALHEAGCGR